MNEIRDLLIGIDIGKEYTQICYYDRKAEEARSLSMKVGTSQYEAPGCICYRTEQNDYCVGLEAQYFSREKGGIMLGNIYDICQKEESIQVAGEDKEPAELLAHFLKGMLKFLGIQDIVKNTKCMCITSPELDAIQVRNYQKACGIAGFPAEKYMLMDYGESFYYYALGQKRETWNRSVAWYAFDGDKIAFRKLTINAASRPILVNLEEPVSTTLETEDEIRDVEFCRFITKTLGKELFSSVQITGEGFDQQWAQQSVKLLCHQGRKVFYGNNLFAKGACIAGKDRLEDKKLKGYRYLSDSLVTADVGMDMRVMGSPAYYPLIEGGSNWYECNAECELILDDTEELVFVVNLPDETERKRVAMALKGLPKRPNRTTRLALTLKYVSSKDCEITVKDLGFGEMYPSSGKTWKELVRWDETEERETGMSGYILCQVKKAEKPFYIENISTNIYSIEELCYYLYNNLYLVDRSLISNKLCTWLDEELKLPKLAAKLRPFIGKEAGLEEILYPIFKEINYLAYEELRILNGRIERRNKESEEIREKRKGDALMENRMYVNAIRVYQKLLEKDSREISREMRERILHNQGCAYSYLFQMDKALDCFFAAWKVNQSEKALKIYLLAYRSVHTPEEFEKIQEDLKAEDSVKKETARALEQFISLPEQKIAPGETDRILEDLTREYHRSTGS